MPTSILISFDPSNCYNKVIVYSAKGGGLLELYEGFHYSNFTYHYCTFIKL